MAETTSRARKTTAGRAVARKPVRKAAGLKPSVPPMFPRILCPLDFSDPAISALREAIRLAQTFSSRLHLLHVVTTAHLVEPIPTSPEFNFVTYQKELLRLGRQKLARTVQELVPAGLDVKQTVGSGIVADEILKVADREKSSLIVIATHGRTGWRHLVFGSVTEKVIRQATCPVLTIHPENRGGK